MTSLLGGNPSKHISQQSKSCLLAWCSSTHYQHCITVFPFSLFSLGSMEGGCMWGGAVCVCVSVCLWLLGVCMCAYVCMRVFPISLKSCLEIEETKTMDSKRPTVPGTQRPTIPMQKHMDTDGSVWRHLRQGIHLLDRCRQWWESLFIWKCQKLFLKGLTGEVLMTFLPADPGCLPVFWLVNYIDYNNFLVKELDFYASSQEIKFHCT